VTREDGELTLVLGQQKRRRGSYSMTVSPVRDLTVLGARAVSYGDHSPSALLDCTTYGSKKPKKCSARSVHNREQRLCASRAKGPRGPGCESLGTGPGKVEICPVRTTDPVGPVSGGRQLAYGVARARLDTNSAISLLCRDPGRPGKGS